MKQLVLAAFAMVAVSSAQASESCAPYQVYNGEGNPAIVVYPCGPNAAVKHQVCTEGKTELFIVANTDSDGSHIERRTCHNGAFYPTASVKPLVCKEGQKEAFLVQNTENDGSHWERVVCRNGRFVNQF